MITIKRGDTVPDLSITVTDNGTIVDLTTATTVKVIGTINGSLIFSRVVTGTALGVVTMPWQPADTATAGMLEIEVEVTWPGTGKIQTFPADGVLRVNVEQDLNTSAGPPPPPNTAFWITEDPDHPGLYILA